MARGKHDAYIVDLFTALALDEHPLKPLPHWFHAHLWGDTTDFYPLHKAIITLNNWGILAEIQRYQVLDREVAMLQAESHLVDANLAASESARQACEDCLVTMQVAEKVKPVGVEHFKPQIAQQSGWRKSTRCGCPF